MASLKQLWSWADVDAWNPADTPDLPSVITGLFERCASTKAARLPTESCPCLTFLDLSWEEALGCVFCHKHQRLLQGDFIWSHIAARGHPAEGKFAKAKLSTVYRALLCHATHCHPIIKEQSAADVKANLPKYLDQPLSLPLPNNSVNLRYKCPVKNCRVWTAVNRGKGSPQSEHISHFRGHPLTDQRSCSGYDVPAQRTQLVDIGAGKSKLKTPLGEIHYFLLPDIVDVLSLTVLTAEAVSLTRHNPSAPSTQKWGQELGWDNYISAISRNGATPKGATAKLRELVARPSIDLVNNAVDDSSRAVEKALLTGTIINKRYLEDGAQWVTSLHPAVAERFTFKKYVLQSLLLKRPNSPLEANHSKHSLTSAQFTSVDVRLQLLNACFCARCSMSCRTTLVPLQSCTQRIHYVLRLISWS